MDYVNKLRSLWYNRHGAGMMGTLIMVMLMILIVSALVGTVAWKATAAGDKANVAYFAGVSTLVDLWPLFFILVPIMAIVWRLRT